jgi:ATP-dependent Lhr-like helicase
MPDAFPIFFDRRRPFDSQALVMPEIVRGNDVFFAAPTASGKTEAAVAPLYQRHLSYRRERLSTVYVAPTKALVNDLHERLVGYLGTRFPDAICRYTGDRHEVGSTAGAFCVLATPEALDSLQLRQPEALAHVRSVIIDEIHLLHGEARGQQLRHVIDRIEAAARPPRASSDRFQRVGMTATLADMDSVARLWMGPAAKVLSHGTPREIDLSFLTLPAVGDPLREKAEELADWIRSGTNEKVLVFANSRNGAHALAAHLHRELEGSRWPVHLHFGALSAAHRERVEEDMRRNRYGVCVATSTLEIGIDIGDIDAIVLADPPHSVSSFLQRIGRGNRRTGTCKVIAFRATPDDELLMRALADCGRRGELDDIHEYDRPSVRFQQVLSLCWRATRADKVMTRQKLSAEAGCDHGDVVGDMLDTGCLADVGGALVPCDRLVDAADAGNLHTVIAGRGGPSVVDMRTGDVALRDADPVSRGGGLFVGGSIRRVGVGADGQVFLDESGRPQATSLARIRGTGTGPAQSRAIVRGLAYQADADPDRWQLDPLRLVTWGGQRFNDLLAALFERENSALKFSATPFDVVGPMSHLPINLRWLRDLAEVARQRDDLPLSVAQKFMSGSRFINELSGEAQGLEKRSAVPWNGFLRWLETIEAIETGSGS